MSRRQFRSSLETNRLFYSANDGSQHRMCGKSVFCRCLLSIESEWSVVHLHLSRWNLESVVQFIEYVSKTHLLHASCETTSADSTRTANRLPAEITRTTTPPTSFIFSENVKYRAGNTIQSSPTTSNCNPTARDSCSGGQCVLTVDGIHRCRCRDGYTGAYCENS